MKSKPIGQRSVKPLGVINRTRTVLTRLSPDHTRRIYKTTKEKSCVLGLVLCVRVSELVRILLGTFCESTQVILIQASLKGISRGIFIYPFQVPKRPRPFKKGGKKRIRTKN